MVLPRELRRLSRHVHTIGDLLAGCTAMLESVGVGEPQREARDIVAAVLDVPRFWAAANSVADASPDVARSVIRAAMARAGGAPLAYAVGRASFRYLSLVVDERVLIPRVETEVLVERVLDRSTPRTRRIADVGTGSGAIALSLAFEREFELVIATDISLDAMAVAAANAASLSTVLKSPVEFRHGSLLAPLAGEKLDAIVCNPPYISFAEIADLPPDVRDWEPSLALLCPEDGLSVTRALIRSAPSMLASRGFLALEVDTRCKVLVLTGAGAAFSAGMDLKEFFVFATRA